MTILITGCNGLLGSNLINYFSNSNYYVLGTSLSESTINHNYIFIKGDLSDESFVKKLILNYSPDIIINTVALVNLELCEKNQNHAYKTNVKTVINLADSITENVHLIHISTDHLFDGNNSYYTEDDHPNPLNIYASTKLLSEQEAVKRHKNTTIIRTNIFGWSPKDHVDTFGEWIYNNLKSNRSIKLFRDYFFTPIEINLFIKALEEIIKNKISGVYNICGTERCSKLHFGTELANTFGLNKDLIIESSINEHSFIAKRPNDLSLSTKKFEKETNYKLPNLISSLKSFLNNLNQD